MFHFECLLVLPRLLESSILFLLII
jgi:hypothetical protein